MLTALRSQRGHDFWTDDSTPSDPQTVQSTRLVGHRQVTDAHLLALARRHHGSVATLDKAMTGLAGADAHERVVLLPIG